MKICNNFFNSFSSKKHAVTQSFFSHPECLLAFGLFFLLSWSAFAEEGFQDLVLTPPEPAVRRHEARPIEAKGYEVPRVFGGGIIKLVGALSEPCTYAQVKTCLDQATEFWGTRIRWNDVYIRFQSAGHKGGYVFPGSSQINFTKRYEPGWRCENFCHKLIHELAHVWGNQKGTSTDSSDAILDHLAHLFSAEDPYINIFSADEDKKMAKWVAEGRCVHELGAEAQADVIRWYWAFLVSKNTSCTTNHLDNIAFETWLSPEERAALKTLALQLLEPEVHSCGPQGH